MNDWIGEHLEQVHMKLLTIKGKSKDIALERQRLLLEELQLGKVKNYK